MNSEEPQGGHKDGGRAQGVGCAPTLWAPWCPPDLDLPPISSHIFPHHQKHPRKHFSTAATFYSCEIPLGAFFGILPEGDSITEGFYINTIASPMKPEQFTTDLRVPRQQLDGFFSLFDSQYKVLLDVLGDLFDVILFCGVFAEI